MQQQNTVSQEKQELKHVMFVFVSQICGGRKIAHALISLSDKKGQGAVSVTPQASKCLSAFDPCRPSEGHSLAAASIYHGSWCSAEVHPQCEGLQPVSLSRLIDESKLN